MAGNTIGQIFRLTTFGESHGPAIGGVIDGCPAGLHIDMDAIRKEMDRRRTGTSPAASGRREDDTVEFLSGLFEGKTTGTPLAFMIRNKDHRPEDYDHLKEAYRPSHADYTYDVKYGIRDHRGGGRASARETAARVVAGTVAKMMLKETGISIHGFVSRIGTIALEKSHAELDLGSAERSAVRCPDRQTGEAMERLLGEVGKAGDTVGGTVTCILKGVPPGLGEPVFDRFEADLAKAMLSINAVKGFDIGSGIHAAEVLGSEHNDMFIMRDGMVSTTTNRSGGVLGGITSGQEISFRVFFKPVATLMQDQDTIGPDGRKVRIPGKGRHDVCVVPRAVPIVEAMAAITVADHFLRNRASKL